ncbi:AbrB/MazE/SpoVT family DNA-binding domain-containing protein [Haloactinopolyspora alba]|uniref:AbrB/MazE/SpoVT family DNA-binding domain-containing protein n=1 Tax=Haloactinopolyspora alba TaxID=648780 RepID=UPI0013EA76B9|nr:AbrB/MazE/SpoVT family DNA-binding domain-containing protein [Haloactinopolyspora alba]
MTQAVLSVSDQGRVVIPVQLRRELNIEPGSHLVAYVEDERLILEDRDHLAARVQKEAQVSRTTRGSVVDDLIAQRRSEADDEQRESDAAR